MVDFAQVDLDSIKTLAGIADKLQKGGLEIPGDVTIKGQLKVEKQAFINTTRQGDDAFRVFLPDDKYFYMNNSSQFGIWSGAGAQPMNFNSPINGTTTFGGITNFNAGINVNGDSTINSSVLKIGDQAKNQWVIHTPADDRGLLMFARTKRDGNINWQASMYIDSTADGANIGTFVARNANHTNIKMGDANMNYDATKKVFVFDKGLELNNASTNHTDNTNPGLITNNIVVPFKSTVQHAGVAAGSHHNNMIEYLTNVFRNNRWIPENSKVFGPGRPQNNSANGDGTYSNQDWQAYKFSNTHPNFKYHTFYNDMTWYGGWKTD